MFEYDDGTLSQSDPVAPQQVVRMLFFNELVRAGSITKAAETMNVSISTGSRWLSELEEQLGVLLYRRNDKENRVTDAGEYLFKKMSLINSNIKVLSNELAQFTKVTKGNVKVCCTPIYAEKILLPLIYEFVDKNSAVNIQLTINPYGLDYPRDYDLIISAIAGVASNKESDLQLVKRNLVSDKFVLIASPQYIKKWSEPLVPNDLVMHRCLYSKALYNKNRWVFRQGDNVQMMTVPPTIELSDANLLARAVIDGLGISYLPFFAVEHYIKRGDAVLLLPDYETDDWLLNIYYPPQKLVPAGVREFKEHILSGHRAMLERFKNATVNS